MTFEEFETLINRENSFDKYYHYFLCISLISFSIFCSVYLILYNPEKFRDLLWLIIIVLIIFFSMGLSGFILLPKRYRIIQIPSLLSINKKKIIFKKIINEFCQFDPITNENYISTPLRTKWWQSNYQLFLFYDDLKFAFSLQGHDYNGGFIDFGETERKRRKLYNALINLAHSRVQQ